MRVRKYTIVFIVFTTIISFSQGVTALSEGEMKSFGYTGNYEVLEANPGLYEFRVWGAQGGDGYNTVGGNGGYAEGNFRVEESKQFYIYVGGQGGTPEGGWNGGGDGGTDYGAGQTGGGGGGASDIRVGATKLEDRVIVAGGGAGGGRDGQTGEGGGLTGTASDDYKEGKSGEPGTQNQGGGVYTTSRGATSGQLGKGGHGSTNEDAAGGGGGGAGYYGGGGGTSTQDHGYGYSSGGGGGSSYIEGLDNASTSTGVNEGNGRIEIELIEEGSQNFCDYRGPLNECVMNGTNQLQSQQYNVSSIFESRSNAVFEALSGQAILNVSNTTTISGFWEGSFSINTESARVVSGARFKPEGGRIIVGE